MGSLISFYKSSVGAKVVMAVTGILLALFVLGHMVGNLQVFIGQDALNTYAEFLQSKPALVWTVRITLLVALVLHEWSSITLTLHNQAARPIGYMQKRSLKATLFSRNMWISGLVIFAFLVYHLLQFTFLTTNPEFVPLVDSHGRPDVYTRVILAFQQPLIAGSYMIAMALLAAHLSHAVTSVFQTFNFGDPNHNRWVGLTGPLYAWVIIIGNVSMPLAIMLGYVSLPLGAL